MVFEEYCVLEQVTLGSSSRSFIRDLDIASHILNHDTLGMAQDLSVLMRLYSRYFRPLIKRSGPGVRTNMLLLFFFYSYHFVLAYYGDDS